MFSLCYSKGEIDSINYLFKIIHSWGGKGNFNDFIIIGKIIFEYCYEKKDKSINYKNIIKDYIRWLNDFINECIRVEHHNEIYNGKKSIIYELNLADTQRAIISRWRLSCHMLKIETGRYTKPVTPRELRTCSVCLELESEHHSLFCCPVFKDIRDQFSILLERKSSCKLLLNPQNLDEAIQTAEFLKCIEKRYTEYFK